MTPRSNSKLRITGDDLVEIDRNLASKLGLDEVSQNPVQAKLEGSLFNGRIEIHNPCSGLYLFALEVRLERDIELLVDMERPVTVVSLVLGGSCTQRIQRSNKGESSVEFKSGKNVLCTFHAEKSRFELTGGHAHRIVDLHIDADEIGGLTGAKETALAEPLRSILLQARGSRLNVESPLPYGLEVIARQILQCTFQGVSRQLFMAGKAFEILALQLDAFSQVRSPKGGLSALESKRLEVARSILEKEFEDPPSLLQLSRKVGLNDFKLKRGFREAYNTTVFGYVRRLRMERARALLETGDFNVTEAAVTTGYSCLGHFTEAFKKHFGFLPSDVLRKSSTGQHSDDQTGFEG